MMRRHSRHQEGPPTPDPAADRALERAKAESLTVRRLWPRVNTAADTLARERETNHFAERIASALGAQHNT